MDDMHAESRHAEACDACCDRAGHTRPCCEEPCEEALHEMVELGYQPTAAEIRTLAHAPCPFKVGGAWHDGLHVDRTDTAWCYAAASGIDGCIECIREHVEECALVRADG